MTNRAQLTFAELIDRGVPLSAAEAAALVLAVSRSSQAVPADDDIVLNSTGEVICGPSDRRTLGPPAPEKLAQLLHRLLRLDEPGGGERRGRIPGGLLVVLARTQRQIDLPPLSRDAFHDALERFAHPDPPVALAAVFWRAARMRPRGARRLGWGHAATAQARRERRTHGPTTTDLRHWLRQSEQELFRLRRSRAATVGAAAMLGLIVAAILGIGAAMDGDRPPRAAAASSLPQVVAAPATVLLESSRPQPAVERGGRLSSASERGERLEPARPARPARPAERAQRDTPTPTVRPPAKRRTVHMVNLPRTPWSVVRRLDTADNR